MKTHPSPIEILETRIALSVFTVTTIADAGAGSLRDALAQADAHPGADKVVFHLLAPPPNSVNTIMLTSGEISSLGGVTIKGPGAGKLIIDGNNASRIFHFDDTGTATDSPVKISGLSILHGRSGFGGGILSTESLVLKNAIVSGNTSTGSGGGVVVYDVTGSAGIKAVISGSLIANNSAAGVVGGLDLAKLQSIKISKTVVTGNTAANFGGGIYAGISSSGTGISITGCVISGNKAGFGGGVRVLDGNASPEAKAVITRTKITGNISTNAADSLGGGGLFVSAGETVVTGSTISKNQAVYNGGGIQANGFTTLTIAKSRITGNRTTGNDPAGNGGGGGVFIEGSSFANPQQVKIIGSRIADNESGRNGGGLFARGGIALSVAHSVFSENGALFGGGLGTSGAGKSKVNLTVSGSTFSDNASSGAGGGIQTAGDGEIAIMASKFTRNSAAGSGGGLSLGGLSVTLKKSAVTGNLAGFNGGGLYLTAAESEVSGSLFTGNAARNSGGGIATSSGISSIMGTAVSGNAADRGGGVGNDGPSPGNVTLQIAKVVANTARLGPNIAGTFTLV